MKTQDARDPANPAPLMSESTPVEGLGADEACRRVAGSTLPSWLAGLTHQDWLIDGCPCKAADWARLDWSRAWVDLGPSPAGNPGPYWHVPAYYKEDDDERVHRLYPKLLKTRWQPVAHRAGVEMAERAQRHAALPEALRRLLAAPEAAENTGSPDY